MARPTSHPRPTANRAVFSRPGDAHLLDAAEMLRFHILYLGSAEVGVEWSTGETPFTDGTHHLHLVRGGRAQWRWDGGTMDLRPGYAYWAPAQVPLCRRCDHIYRHFVLVFRCEWLRGVDLLWNGRAPVCLGRWNMRRFVTEWTGQTADALTFLRLDGLLRTLFLRSDLLQPYMDQQRELRGRFAPMFELFAQRNLPDASLTVGTIASTLGMTHNGFSRLFRRHFGTSPKAYLRDRVNQAACEMLATSDHPIRWIADQLNFSNEYYFNRFFSQVNGISPGRYRASRIRSGPGMGATVVD